MALAALKQELEVWDSALEAFDSRDYENALKIFESFADTSKIIANIGLIRVLQEEYELAVKSFTRAVELDRFLAMAYFQRGVCHLHLTQFEKAAEDFGDAEICLRSNASINYEELGLDFVLYAAEILFNKAKALVHLDRTEEGLTFLRRAVSSSSEQSHAIIKDATADTIKGMDAFAIPDGILFRPSPSKRKFLEEYEISVSSSHPSKSGKYSSPPSPGLSERAKSDVSSTCAPSSGSEAPSKKRSFRSFSTALDAASTSHPLRSDLNKVMGPDLLLPTTEISTIPCAGVRIPYGKLTGLMAWRLVVSLEDESPELSRRQKQKQKDWTNVPRPAVVANFILDTGSAHSHVPQQTLRALGYKGSFKAGTEVTLCIQGIKTKCVIARYGEAGRLGGQFMTSGSLTFYFDAKLNAPVLYVGDVNERPTDIPRTVTIDSERKSRRRSFRDSVQNLLLSLNFLRDAETKT
ncbi:hypothetical protein D9758_005185 [Tetrapyrgos nigripes]|uniref:Uncharacterized protein n=1 Tax=Tetrapyrgos nigripes TaxID=182062 RepID=A0A8H5GWY2_9AGAR|nr:hypothetical protein D9758_005185 [Tetrapyrgos nigripes]